MSYEITVPILLNHDQKKAIGELRITDLPFKMDEDWGLAIGYKKNDDGTVELLEVSVVPMEKKCHTMR